MGTNNTTCNKSVAETLLDAALYIDSHGWCQGNLFNEVPGALPRACMLGAIKVVTDDSGNEHGGGKPNPAVQHAISYLADFLDDGIYRDLNDGPVEVVWQFNDHPDTTQQLVINALRTAAKRARAELSDGQVTS